MKLGMKHRWLKYCNVYINHDPVMTLTQFMARSAWVAHAFEWGKLLKCHLKGKNSRKLAYGQNIDYSEKENGPRICPCTGVKYHNIQTCLLVHVKADLRWAFTGPLVLWFVLSHMKLYFSEIPITFLRKIDSTCTLTLTAGPIQR